MIPDVRSLRCFVALAGTGSFSDAARAVHLAQPTLSQRIARLEDLLGFALFDRRPKDTVLTPAGAEFLPHARALLERADGLVATAERIRDGRAGSLRVGYTPLSFFAYVPGLIHAFIEQHPDVRLHLTEHVSNDVEEGVTAGRLDLGFLHPPLHGQPLPMLQLRGERFLAVLRDGHRLAGQETIDFGQLADEPLILTRRSIGPVIFDRLIGAIRAGGVNPRIAHEVANSIAVIGLVAAGQGIGFVIEPMAAVTRPGVVYRPMRGDEVPKLPFALAWNDGPAHSARDRFATFAESYCRTL